MFFILAKKQFFAQLVESALQHKGLKSFVCPLDQELGYFIEDMRPTHLVVDRDDFSEQEFTRYLAYFTKNESTPKIYSFISTEKLSSYQFKQSEERVIKPVDILSFISNLAAH